MPEEEKRTEQINFRITESEERRAEVVNAICYGGALDHPTTLIYKIFQAGLSCLEKGASCCGEAGARNQPAKRKKK